MPQPPTQHLSYLNDKQAGPSLLSSVTSSLWTVMTLGLASSSNTVSTASNSNNTNIQKIPTHLPNLPSDIYSNPNSNVTETLIDCHNRLLAWQSVHILLVLSNHCTNESLYNPYRLALFHFTDTLGNVESNLNINFFYINYEIVLKIHQLIYQTQNHFPGLALILRNCF
jgi:hypothetical protein